MFLPNSRYGQLATVDTTTSTGETVSAIKLRTLTPVTGSAQMVEANERLDLIAQRVSGDATLFWHIADANTALDGRTLTQVPGATLVVPKA